MTNGFLNLTNLEESEAKEKLEEFKFLVERGEEDRQPRAERDEENRKFWRSEIWDDSTLKEFFEEYDLTPYNFPMHRTLINNLITRQRNRRLAFDLVPADVESFKRYKDGEDKFVAENSDMFDTSEEAREYYQNYADDEYAEALTVMMQNYRIESKAKYVESEVFERGLVSGLDFFKAQIGDKYNREGGIEILRRPQAAMIFDETSTQYDLSDIEYIGEVQRLYKNQLIHQYPENSDRIEEHFSYYTNLGKSNLIRYKENWSNWFDFSPDFDTETQVKVAELWYLDKEKVFTVYDNQTKTTRHVRHGMDEEDIAEELMSLLLMEYKEQAKSDPSVAEFLNSEEAKEQIAQEAQKRYEINHTWEPIWYKAVFTFNALLEFKRTPYQHKSHPYYPFYANYTEGEFNSLIDDIKDIIKAINKALAFRELMMAHGAKNLVIVDEKTLSDSGYDIEEISDIWTSIGGMIALKLKGNQRVEDVFKSVTTVGEGLLEINNILQDLDNRLYSVSGVNLAQLGVVERETTSSGYRMQVSEGEANNGLIYDNFYRSLEGFYNDKVVPLVAQLMEHKEEKVVRYLGDKRSKWINVDYGEKFTLFQEAVRSGKYATVLKPRADNPQLEEERSAKMMEMIAAGLIPVEIGLEFTNHPDKYDLIRKLKKYQINQAYKEQYAMINMQRVRELLMQNNVPYETAMKMVEDMQREVADNINQQSQQTGEQVQRGQGMETIRQTGSQTKQNQNTQRNTLQK